MAPSLAFFYKYMFHIGLPISSGYAWTQSFTSSLRL
jgi:hypothetical protein